MESSITAMQDPFNQNKGELEAGGKLLGNLTVAQAILRPLNAGESRYSLCLRTRKKLDKNKKENGFVHQVDPKLDMSLSAMTAST